MEMQMRVPTVTILTIVLAVALARPVTAACRTAEAGAVTGAVVGSVVASTACGPLFFLCAAITTATSSMFGSGFGTMIDQGIRECDEVTTDFSMVISAPLDHPRLSGRHQRGTGSGSTGRRDWTRRKGLYVADAPGEALNGPSRDMVPVYMADAIGEGSFRRHPTINFMLGHRESQLYAAASPVIPPGDDRRVLPRGVGDVAAPACGARSVQIDAVPSAGGSGDRQGMAASPGRAGAESALGDYSRALPFFGGGRVPRESDLPRARRGGSSVVGPRR